MQHFFSPRHYKLKFTLKHFKYNYPWGNFSKRNKIQLASKSTKYLLIFENKFIKLESKQTLPPIPFIFFFSLILISSFLLLFPPGSSLPRNGLREEDLEKVDVLFHFHPNSFCKNYLFGVSNSRSLQLSPSFLSKQRE